MLILSSASPFWVSLVPSLSLSVYRSRSFSQFVMGCRNQHLSSTCYPFWPMCLPEVKWSEVKSLSCVWLFATPWTVAHQAPLCMRFFQARILEWVAIFFSRGSSIPRDQTPVSCIGRWILHHWATREAQWLCYRDHKELIHTSFREYKGVYSHLCLENCHSFIQSNFGVWCPLHV